METKRKSLEELTPIVNGNDAPWNHPLIQLLDPTGITSYPEVKRTVTNPNSTVLDNIAALYSAVPAIGKVGKVINLLGNILGFSDNAKRYYKDQAHNYDAIYYSPSIREGKVIGRLGPMSSLSRDASLYPATKQEIEYYMNNTKKDTDVINYIRSNKKK